jgi:transposase-like protein
VRRSDASVQLHVRDWEFPREHWKHLRTTNSIESPFAWVRLRTSAAKRFKKVANATADRYNRM